MLIGIDASRAVSHHPTGTETYSRELIRALLAIDQRNTYRLYTREPVEREWFRTTGNADVCVMPSPRLWTYVRLAPEVSRRPPDLLFVPAHVLPPLHPRHSIVTVHDLGHFFFPEAYPAAQRWYHYWTTRWNCRAASNLLADSEATRDDLVKYCHVSSDKITVVYPAYDCEIFNPSVARDQAYVLEKKFGVTGEYILAVGTLHPRKNYALLIEAFRKMISNVSFSQLNLVIAGRKGWLFASILQKVREWELEDRVRFLDFVAESDLPTLMGGARLLAFPSLHEGFGIPVLEAQACGTPVVCSMTSSMPEVAGDGALFVDPRDADAIGAAMSRLLTDEGLRNKIIRNGFENVKRFSWEKSARQVLDVFDNSR